MNRVYNTDNITSTYISQSWDDPEQEVLRTSEVQPVDRSLLIELYDIQIFACLTKYFTRFLSEGKARQ